MPFDGVDIPNTAPSDAMRVHKGMHALRAYLGAVGVFPGEDVLVYPGSHDEFLGRAIREPWQQACEKNRQAEAAAGRPVDEKLDAKLEALIARTMNQILTSGLRKSTPPAIARALMREIVQQVQQFRHNPAFLTSPPAAQDIMLGHLEQNLRKHALKRHSHLMRYHQAQEDHELSGHAGLAKLLGFGADSSLMHDGEEWLTSLHHDARLDHAR